MISLAIIINRFGYALVQWIIMVMISKNMSHVMLGSYTYLLAIAGPIFLLAQSNLVSFLLADRLNTYSQALFIKHRLYFSILGFSVLLLITSIVTNDLLFIGVLIGLVKICESIFDLDLGFLQLERRSNRIIYKCILRFLGISIAAYLYMRDNDLFNGLLSILFVNVLFLFLIDFKWKNNQEKELSELIKKTIPLGLVMIVASLGANIPVYIIEYYNGKAAVARFSILFYFVIVGRMFVSALCQSKISKISHLYESNKSKLKSILKHFNLRIYALGTLSLIFLSYFGNYIVEVFYGSYYRTSTLAMIYIGCYMMLSFISQAQNTITTAIGRGSFVIFVELVALIVLSVMLILLLPKNTDEAVFLSMLASGIIHCLLSIYLQKITIKN